MRGAIGLNLVAQTCHTVNCPKQLFKRTCFPFSCFLFTCILCNMTQKVLYCAVLVLYEHQCSLKSPTQGYIVEPNFGGKKKNAPLDDNGGNWGFSSGDMLNLNPKINSTAPIIDLFVFVLSLKPRYHCFRSSCDPHSCASGKWS